MSRFSNISKKCDKNIVKYEYNSQFRANSWGLSVLRTETGAFLSRCIQNISVYVSFVSMYAVKININGYLM